MTSPTITIHIRYFAMMRELIGKSDEMMTLQTPATARDAFAQLAAATPRIAGLEKSIMLMVNEEYARADHVLQDGDDLAFIPPVSGGSDEEGGVTLMRLFRVTDQVIDPRQVETAVAGPDAGAVVTFSGNVRDNARGRDVQALDYEAYVPAAEKMLAHIGVEILDRWPSVRTAITHRTGLLHAGETSVVIACASAHRAQAFEAAAYAIDRIKEIVPIWKKEHYSDGSTWIGSEADYQQEIGRLPKGINPQGQSAD